MASCAGVQVAIHDVGERAADIDADRLHDARSFFAARWRRRGGPHRCQTLDRPCHRGGENAQAAADVGLVGVLADVVTAAVDARHEHHRGGNARRQAPWRHAGPARHAHVACADIRPRPRQVGRSTARPWRPARVRAVGALDTATLSVASAAAHALHGTRLPCARSRRPEQVAKFNGQIGFAPARRWRRRAARQRCRNSRPNPGRRLRAGAPASRSRSRTWRSAASRRIAIGVVPA